jgi:molecular chaperone DnaK
MVREAETHAEEDQALHKLVETRNQADSMVYSLEKTLKDLGEKVTEEEKTKAEAAMEKVRTAIQGEDVEAIEKSVEELTTVSHEFAERLYEQAAQDQPDEAQAGQEEAGAGATMEDEDVTDAEFEVAPDDDASDASDAPDEEDK